jgi:hypothetical protein
MINSIGGDDTGGTSPENNREYSGRFGGRNGVYDRSMSAIGSPSQGEPLATRTTGTTAKGYHSHPSGKEPITINGESYTVFWQQPPSRKDISEAGTGNSYHYVVGMGSGLIYIYNRRGVVATIPISTFKK